MTTTTEPRAETYMPATCHECGEVLDPSEIRFVWIPTDHPERKRLVILCPDCANAHNTNPQTLAQILEDLDRA